MTKIKLIRECPFCGGTPELNYKNFWGEWLWEIRCPECGVGTDGEETDDGCIAVWNKRDSKSFDKV